MLSVGGGVLRRGGHVARGCRRGGGSSGEKTLAILLLGDEILAHVDRGGALPELALAELEARGRPAREREQSLLGRRRRAGGRGHSGPTARGRV